MHFEQITQQHVFSFFLSFVAVIKTTRVKDEYTIDRKNLILMHKERGISAGKQLING